MIKLRYGSQLAAAFLSISLVCSIANAQFHASLGPAIGTDHLAPIPIDYANVPALATDGETIVTVYEESGHIRATRVTAQGAQLNLPPIDLGSDAYGQYYPQLAYGNGVYIAIWTQFGDVEADDGVYARAIAADGSLIGEQNVPVARGAGLYGTITYTGSEFLVAWWNSDIFTAKVDATANLVSGSEQQVTTSGSTGRPIFATGTNISLLTFQQKTSEAEGAESYSYAARFDAEGTLLDPEGILLSDQSTGSYYMAAAATPDDTFLIGWETWTTDGIQGALLDSTGAVLVTDLDLSRTTNESRGPAIDFDGENFFVAWFESQEAGTVVQGTKVTPSGAFTSVASSTFSGSLEYGVQGWDIDLLWSEGRHLLAFHGSGIEGHFLDADLAAAAPGNIALGITTNTQGRSVSTWNGSTYVLAWSDERFDSDQIFRATRINTAGTVLDPEGLALTAEGEYCFNTDIASSDAITLAAWTSTTTRDGIHSRTISADGSLGPSRVLIPGAITNPFQVDSTGNSFLVAYPGEGELMAQLLDAQGEPSGESFALAPGSGLSMPTVKAWNDQYVVVASQPSPTIMLVSESGQVTELGAFGTTGLSSSLSVGSDSMLVTWSDRNTTDNPIMARYLLSDGTWQGTATTLSASSSGYAPALAFDGTNFLASWETERPGLDFTWLGSDGPVSDAALFVDVDLMLPVLTAGPPGQVLLSYTQWYHPDAYRRVVSHLIGGAIADPTTEPADGVKNDEMPDVVVNIDDADAEPEAPGSESSDNDSLPLTDTLVDDDSAAEGATTTSEELSSEVEQAVPAGDADTASTGLTTPETNTASSPNQNGENNGGASDLDGTDGDSAGVSGASGAENSGDNSMAGDDSAADDSATDDSAADDSDFERDSGFFCSLGAVGAPSRLPVWLVFALPLLLRRRQRPAAAPQTGLPSMPIPIRAE